jgi:hypothetical protein
MGTGTKDDESSTGCICTAHSCLACFETYELFFFGGGMTQSTADTESADTGSQLYIVLLNILVTAVCFENIYY